MYKVFRSLNATFVIALVLILWTPAILAQDTEETEFEGLVMWTLEFEGWVPQPAGLDLMPATRHSQTDPYDTQGVFITPSTDLSMRYKAAAKLHNNLGEVVLTWFSHQDRSTRVESSPGDFIYGETLAAPYYSGINYDGLADAFDAESYIKTRDLRLSWYHDGFKGKRVSSRWFVGYRRIDHHRSLSADYFALVPGYPPIIDPISNERGDLVPGIDSTRMYSDLSARGGELGIEMDVPIYGKKIWFETGFNYAILRGKVTSEYTSTTHNYFLTFNGDFERIILPPFSEFDEISPQTGEPMIADIRQASNPVGLNAESESCTSTITELFLGIRWNFWKTLELSAGYRSTYYDNIGLELRPTSVVPAGDVAAGQEPIVNVTDAARSEYDVNYEGYFFSLAYKF